MNHLNTSSKETALLKLTPFKICLCHLIYKTAKESTEEIAKETSEISILKYSLIALLLSDSYPSEISKSTLFNTISEKLSLLGTSQQQQSTLSTELKDSIINFIGTIKGINDLYSFFKDKVASLMKTEEHAVSSFSKGGFIDNYLRKCFNAFYKLGFDELSQLFQSLKQYAAEESITLSLSYKENERLLDKCFNNGELLKAIKGYIANCNQKPFLSLDEAHNHYPPLSTASVNDKLYDLHQFFDYNLYKLSNEETSSNPTIPSPNSDNKIHHSLLSLVSFYFDQKCFDKAIQILFECIKLSQSNCDHEALLKCFLWMTKIFIYSGNYSLSAQCLSTCLIKSFQNNFHLIHLLSSVELANLNYVFNGTIGDMPNSIDEKIISHSKNYIQLYKSILEYFTVNEEGESNSLAKLMHYAVCHLLLGLLGKGEYSLALNYLSNISAKVLIEAQSPCDMGNFLSKEMLWSFAMFAVELEEYSPRYSFELFNEVITSKGIEAEKDLRGLIQLFIHKYLAQYTCKGIAINGEAVKEMGAFYEYQLEYFELLALYERNARGGDNEKRLLSYIKRCNAYHFSQFKSKALLVLAKIYLGAGKTSEALVISQKLHEEASNRFEKMNALILLAYCYFQMNNLKECGKCLNQIEDCIEKIGLLSNKFDYYYLKVKFIEVKEKCASVLMENQMIECLINAVLLNNRKKIRKICSVLEPFEQFKPIISEINESLLPGNAKLFNLIDKYPMKMTEVFQALMVVNQSNMSFIDKWLKRYE